MGKLGWHYQHDGVPQVETCRVIEIGNPFTAFWSSGFGQFNALISLSRLPPLYETIFRPSNERMSIDRDFSSDPKTLFRSGCPLTRFHLNADTRPPFLQQTTARGVAWE